ncbi:MAG: mechanosensitive ion channel [Flavobacteriaceae bacterium]|nr:mechanosensitive ion channel [Flavobacteriaceae bacterium]MDG2387231.1 mechanosensitive ion channel [Flavobacteriaceae bacterium]
MNILNLKSFIAELIENRGLSEFWSESIAFVVLLVLFLILGRILFWITRRLISTFFGQIAARTKSNFDDFLIQNKVPKILSYLPVLLLYYETLPILFSDISETLYSLIQNIMEALVIVLAIALIRAALKTVSDYLKTVPSFKDKPLDSYLQVFMIFLWFVGGILILSVLTGKDIGAFLTTLGALSAVLLFVFKDTILGFVASVQITVNDTVRIGDWISMPNSKADGDVIAISLSTVQVQNFDKTITSIPTYKLISDSFINWRGMSESTGRRIKKSILIKISSIRFLETDEIQDLKKIDRITHFIDQREKEIEEANTTQKTNKSLLINGRNFTNLGLFRNYTQAYLESHDQINQKMTVMCRQLAPTAQGIPLEIYAFSKDKVWINYEQISSDIFDHLLAAIPYFHLECFELTPTLPTV